MRYAVTYHQPTAIVDSLSGSFTSLDVPTLAVAKANKVELFQLTPSGLRYDSGLEVWGSITNLCEVKREDKTSLLLVTTDHPDPYLLVLSHSALRSPSLSVVNSVSLKARAGRIAEFCQRSAVDSTGRVSVTSAYTGSLKVCVFGSDGKMKESDVRIREQSLLSFAFVPLSPNSTSPPTLALLHIDHNGIRHLLTRSLTHLPPLGSIKSDEPIDISDPTSHISDLVLDEEFDADMVVPVPAPANRGKAGVLILGEGRVRWIEVKDTSTDPKGKRRSSSSATSPTSERRKGKGILTISEEHQARLPYGKTTTCTFLPDDGSRALVSDAYGKLYLLSIACNETTPMDRASIQVHCLGETSAASSITHLTSSYFFIGSKCGDSQVIRLLPSSSRAGSHVEVIDSITNLAPISDFIVSDPESTGQSQIVTCSGGMNSGSLRVIRSGVAFEDMGLVDQVMNTRAIYPLRISYDSTDDLYILVSSISHTTLYSISGDAQSPSFEEIDTSQTPDLIRTRPTLACGNLKMGSLIVHVTAEAVVVIDVLTWAQEYRWHRLEEIVCAAVSGNQVVVGLKGGTIVYLVPSDKEFITKGIRVPSVCDLPPEVSCIALDPTMSEQLHDYAVVGHWGTNAVEILDLQEEKLPSIQLATPILPEPHLPTSLHLTTFGNTSKAHLLVGLGNGTLSSYVVGSEPGTGIVVGERKSFSLGTKPVMLNACRDATGAASVFACGDRPAIIFLKNDRMQTSPIKLRDIYAGSKLNTVHFPNTFIFASATSLLIGRVQELQKLDVRSVPLGLDTPVRIAHHEGLRAYGVVCQRREINRESGAEIGSSSFKLFDDVNLEHINNFTALPEEEIMAISTIQYRDKNYESEFIALGTYQTEDGEEDPRRGRILLFEEASNRKLRLVCSEDTAGCVYAIAQLDNMVAAAVNGTVRIYSIEIEKSSDIIALSPLYTWTSAYVASSLVSRGNTLLVGDLMRSVCVLQWTGTKLDPVYHDYTSLWVQTVASVDDSGVIASELNHNVVTWTLEGKQLERDGSWYFGEGINRFRNAAVATSMSWDGTRPSLVFCTTTGRIGVIASLDDELALHLSDLQRNMGYVIQGPGKVDHIKRRAPQASLGLPNVLAQGTQPIGFIDGDFVERFLDLDQSGSEIKQIMEGKSKLGHERLKKSYAEVIKVLEELQRLR